MEHRPASAILLLIPHCWFNHATAAPSICGRSRDDPAIATFSLNSTLQIPSLKPKRRCTIFASSGRCSMAGWREIKESAETSVTTMQKWGSLFSFLLTVTFIVPPWIYLVGDLRAAIGPFAYALA